MGIFKNSDTIESYTNESITGDYISTTGGLTIGAKIVYYGDGTFTFVPLIESEQLKLEYAKQKGYTMHIKNNHQLLMRVLYNTKNITTNTLSSKLSKHVENENIHGDYSIIKQLVSEEGYFSTYQLTKNSTPIGAKINIPKDYLVKSGTLETCIANNVPVNGYIIGDKYLKFIVNTIDTTGVDNPIFIKVTDLIDVYTEGNGIDITNNSIAVKIGSVSNGLVLDSTGLNLNQATSSTAGAMLANEKNKLSNIKKSIVAETTATVLATGWSGTAPYTYNITLSIPNYTITDANNITLSPVYSSIVETAKLQMEAYSYISIANVSANNTITLKCYDFVPTVDLNFEIEIIKDFSQEELFNYIDNKITVISSLNLDTLFDVGLYFGYNCIGTPILTMLGNFTLQVHGSSNKYSQILIDSSTGHVFVRTYNGTTWTSWEKISGSVKGETYYSATHGCGANYGSGTWISGDTNRTDFKTKAKSAIIIGSDTAKNSSVLVDLIAIGDGIAPSGKIGDHNIFMGLWAGHKLNIGSLLPSEAGDRNIGIGSLSYTSLTTGRANTGLGRDTAQCCVEGSFNAAVAYQALAGQAPIGLDGTIDNWWDGTYTHINGIGYQAGQEVVDATADTFIGSFCGKQVKAGSYSNLIGYNCGVNLEWDRSYNGKRVVLVNESATYTTNGTTNIIVTKTGHQAANGNYVTLTFTSGSCNKLSTEIQLLYVNNVAGNTFTLTAPVNVPIGSGDCTISRYEVAIGGETLGLLNSSNIVGTGAAYYTKRVNQSNLFGMRACNRVECDSVDIIGYSSFYGLTGIGVAKESQIIGAFSCFNVDDILSSTVTGYQSCYNATTKILDSVVNGWKSCFNATTIEQSIVLGEEGLANTTTIQKTVTVGGNTKHVYSSLNKCTFIGEMAGEGTDVGITSLENATAIGYNSGITGNNQVQLGDVNTTTYVYGTVQNRSDERDKINIKDTELGLDFINKLRPVDFKWDYREKYVEIDENGKEIIHEKDGSKAGIRNHHGFIAQEVEEIIETTGIDFGGYQDHSLKGGSDVKSLGYDEFVAPLVKSVQELTKRILELEEKVKYLENK